jgi:predicted nucleotidyltransferase component of viral defense system
MGKIQILTEHQKEVLDAVSSDELLANQFYFTGGTALSLVYLQHRESVDLDFFCENIFETEEILKVIGDLQKKSKFKLESRN